MYANIDNPPATNIQMASPHIDTSQHFEEVMRLSKLLVLMVRVRNKTLLSISCYRKYSLRDSPFSSRKSYEEDIRKWGYINWRLERYYLKKVCELNSETYRSIIDNG